MQPVYLLIWFLVYTGVAMPQFCAAQQQYILPEALPLEPYVMYHRHLAVWKIDLNLLLMPTLGIPQVCSSQCSKVERTTELMTCSQLTTHLTSGNWSLSQISHDDGQCIEPLHALPAEDAAWQRTSRVAATAVPGQVWMPTPDSIIIKDDPSMLALYASMSTPNTTHLSMRMRTTLVTKVPLHAVAAVLYETHNFALRRPDSYKAAVISVQHECTRRGLQAPPLSTLHLFYTRGGLGACVWRCRDGFFRVPWNSAPPVKDTTSDQTCHAFPAEFTAVLFSFVVELPYASVDGLTDTELGVFDALADSFGFHTSMTLLLSLPDSIFDDVSFRAVALRAAGLTSNVLRVIKLSGSTTTGLRSLMSLPMESVAQQYYFPVNGMLVVDYDQYTTADILRLIQTSIQNLSLPDTVLDVDTLVLDTVIHSYLLKSPTPNTIQSTTPNGQLSAWIVVFPVLGGIITLACVRGSNFM